MPAATFRCRRKPADPRRPSQMRRRLSASPLATISPAPSQPGPHGRQRMARARCRCSTSRIRACEARVEEGDKGSRGPRHEALGRDGRRAAPRSRIPLSAAAPRNSRQRHRAGERVLDCCRVNPRQRAAVRVAPLREIPRGQRRGLGEPKRGTVGHGALHSRSRTLRAAVRDESSGGSGEQASGRSQRAPGAAARSAAPGGPQDRRRPEREGDARPLCGRRRCSAPRRSPCAGRSAGQRRPPAASHETPKLLSISGSRGARGEPASGRG